MPTTTRTDAIGQELKVNECAFVVSKSSNLGGDIGLITKINAKTVQINGTTTIDDYRVVIVTENLVNMGKGKKVEDLRKKYEAKVDLTDPTEKPKKPSIRFVLIQDVTGEQHLIRFEGENRDAAVTAMSAIPEIQAIRASYQSKLLCRHRGWPSNEQSLIFDSGHWFGKEAIFAFRTLPDNVARYVNENEPHVIIPMHDRQPQKVVLPKL